MANLPLNGLAAPTAQLLSALPRGRRFAKSDVRAIAERLGMNMNSLAQRMNALRDKRLVTEHPVRDGAGNFLRWEWEVRS